MFESDSLREATNLRLIVGVAESMGIARSACLANTGIREDEIDDPDFKLTLAQEILVTENVVALAPRKTGLGTAVAKRINLHAFGIWGYAILTSPTIRSAFETGVDFAKLSFALSELRFIEGPEVAMLVYDMAHLPRSIHAYVLERQVITALTFLREGLQDDSFRTCHVETTQTDPDYLADLSGLVGIRVVGSAGHEAFVCPAELLDRPVANHDPVTQKYCLNQCKSLLEQLKPSDQPWSRKVREAIMEDLSGEPRIEPVAEMLSTTERTLRRRLAEEGTSFRELHTNVRLAVARELIEVTGLSIKAVAWRIGYSEPATFARAFANKYGLSPGRLRKSAV